MKKIVVPVDFSKDSENALHTAAALANQYGAELYVLHMLEFSPVVVSKAEDEHEMEDIFYLKLAEKKLNEFLDQDYLEGITIIPMIEHYRPLAEIGDIAKEHDADVIIMGSHGTTKGVREVFVGSNTEKVVRNSIVPVLVIKGKPVLNGFKQVVFACDFSPEFVNPFNKAVNMCEMLNATLHIIYVNRPNVSFTSTKETYAKMDAFFKAAESDRYSSEDVSIINDYSIEEGILNFATSIDADLISVPTHGRSGLAHFFNGSITEDIANHANLPVITFKMG